MQTQEQSGVQHTRKPPALTKPEYGMFFSKVERKPYIYVVAYYRKPTPETYDGKQEIVPWVYTKMVLKFLCGLRNEMSFIRLRACVTRFYGVVAAIMHPAHTDMHTQRP